jgi:hypothetical protein
MNQLCVGEGWQSVGIVKFFNQCWKKERKMEHNNQPHMCLIVFFIVKSNPVQ